MMSMDHPFAQRLAEDLVGPLPGVRAQFSMAPMPRREAEHSAQPRRGAKVNGVLILFYPHNDEIYLPLILRPTYPGVHSGQVALPGGRIEEEDESVVDCALREAHEEVGVDPNDVQVLGQLSSLYIGASNNIVYPTVGWTDTRPDFQTDAREVALLIETPLRSLLDPANLRRDQRDVRGRRALVPYFVVCDQIVWGATAMILGELLQLPSIRAERL
jgi:8-oxo-dGTP pyrophosphatase MutT (NUDIX family)